MAEKSLPELLDKVSDWIKYAEDELRRAYRKAKDETRREIARQLSEVNDLWVNVVYLMLQAEESESDNEEPAAADRDNGCALNKSGSSVVSVDHA